MCTIANGKRIYSEEERIVINEFKSSQEEYICHYCGKKLKVTQVTIDHRKPVSRDGETVFENLAIACFKCNSEKGHMTEEEYFEFKKEKEEQYNELNEINSANEYIRLLNSLISLPKERDSIATEIGTLKSKLATLGYYKLYNKLSAAQLSKVFKKEKEISIRVDELNQKKKDIEKVIELFGKDNLSKVKQAKNEISQRYVDNSRKIKLLSIDAEKILSEVIT